MRIRGAVLTASGSPAPFDRSRPIEVQELELDPPGPTEVLVRIEAAGICHSDLSVVDGNRPRPLPMLLGHEAAGRVLLAGDDSGAELVGGRVVMAFLPRCGDCAACATDGRLPCSPGSHANAEGTLLSGARRLMGADGAVTHHLGVSAFATHAVVDRRSVVPVGDDVPPDIAALLGCAVLTGGGAVLNAARPVAGQTLAVVGLGGVGMAALLVALSIPGVRVIGVDPVEAKRRKALDLGAAAAVEPRDAVGTVEADAVIEAAGSARAFETAVAITAIGGRTVSVGLPAGDARAEVSPLSIVAGAREIVGSYLGSAVPARDIPRFEQLWREGRLPLHELISSRIRLDDVNHAMDELAGGRAIRQLIEMPA
ncbi:alcohol dehydrogenase catalytic domain-containing protein [Agromyces kandeliae]|uniref:Alcohol dehydrogenase catalytic domain-containing protein n=1 Tax=Agromyces kandeliae TaxID=2666141 RepID=A0A6L5R3T6_9MICO|nr:alcohol dehydrogenase catalytic domain-containing protein [Agromyces kandeliae]MRX44622.1 alcohol dehydrogenase catalytic domain-containing protein [Agromyces kandeliae]